jgi:hypothetical protein
MAIIHRMHGAIAVTPTENELFPDRGVVEVAVQYMLRVNFLRWKKKGITAQPLAM